MMPFKCAGIERSARKATLGIAVASLCFLAIPTARAAEDCATPTTIKVQEYVGIIQNLVPWVAIDQGFFKKHCLDAKMTNFPSGPAALAASLQGGLDFISLAPDTVYVPASQGFDLKIVAFMNSAIHYSLVAGPKVQLPHKDAGYPEVMKDLVGKNIGVNALGSTTDTLARANFLGAGLDPASQAHWVAYGPPAAGIAGLQNGSLAAAEFFGDGMDIAAAVTGGTIIVDPRDPDAKIPPQIAAMRGASLLWACTTAFINKNPDVVRRFSKANNDAIDWIKDPKNFDQVVRIVRERAPNPPGVPDSEKLLLERVKRYVVQEDKHASMKALKAWNDWDVAMKRIPKPADIDGLLWETARSMIVP